MAKRRGEPTPPVNATRHRRWRVFYDFGGGERRATIETAWYARSPAGETIQARGWNDILAGIDTIEDGLGLDRGERLPMIQHNPPREPGPFQFWSPEARILDLTKPGA